jgi:octaprenyl-diphosphate synthase
MSQLLIGSKPAALTPGDLFVPIARELEEVERILARAVENPRPGIARLVDHVGHYRGKRLRPALLLLVGRACGRLTPAHPVLGAVVELIHTATLVHDDVLDEAAVRRHVPTVNANWGNLNSILLGDYLFSHAYHLAAGLRDPEVTLILAETTTRVCEGELCQGLERGNLALTEADYLDIIDGKTAALLSCCSRLGALVAGADAGVVEGMARYGRWLGLAFQIADDLLDLVGEEKVTGKSLGTDVEQQKLTLPLIRLLERAPAAQAGRLRQLLSSAGNHKREALRPYLDASDALDYARRRADEFAARARKELACLPPSVCRDLLETVCERVVHRSS